MQKKWRIDLSGVVIYNEDRLLIRMRFFFTGHSRELHQQCAEWFLTCRHRLIAFTEQQVDSMTDAEYLLSEVMGKVIAAIVGRNLPQEEWLPYTYTAIRNAAINQKKKNARRLEAEQKYGADESSGIVLPDSDIHEHLRHHLSCLPLLSSRIVRMRIWEELSFAEISRQLDMPESTVRARYQSALLRLRKFYSEDLA